jgi:hypothetical protein
MRPRLHSLSLDTAEDSSDRVPVVVKTTIDQELKLGIEPVDLAKLRQRSSP